MGFGGGIFNVAFVDRGLMSYFSVIFLGSQKV